MDMNACDEFVSCMNKFIQTLSSGNLQFDRYFQLKGQLYLSLDDGQSVEFVVDEKVCKTNVNNSIIIFTNTSLRESVHDSVSGALPDVNDKFAYEPPKATGLECDLKIEQSAGYPSNIDENAFEESPRQGLDPSTAHDLNDIFTPCVVDGPSHHLNDQTSQVISTLENPQESEGGYNLLDIDFEAQNGSLLSENTTEDKDNVVLTKEATEDEKSAKEKDSATS